MKTPTSMSQRSLPEHGCDAHVLHSVLGPEDADGMRPATASAVLNYWMQTFKEEAP